MSDLITDEIIMAVQEQAYKVKNKRNDTRKEVDHNQMLLDSSKERVEGHTARLEELAAFLHEYSPDSAGKESNWYADLGISGPKDAVALES